MAKLPVSVPVISSLKAGHDIRKSSKDTWIHRIAVNAALQLLRKNRPNTWESLEVEVTDDKPRPDDDLAEYELGGDLAAALQRLSEIERICFVLKHMEQWRLKEIAVELDTNIGTVKQAIFRAVKKLRVSMAKRWSEA